MTLEYTQEPDRWPHLLRMWGGDIAQVSERFGVRPNETEDVVAVWFPSQAARKAFIEAMRDIRNVVRSSNDGDDADTSCLTNAEVTLRLPDGREYSYRAEFGYGYPPDSAVFMYTEGNYSCDCNRRLFLERQCGLEPADIACGDTIKLARLRVIQRRPDGSEVEIHDLVEPEA